MRLLPSILVLCLAACAGTSGDEPGINTRRAKGGGLAKASVLGTGQEIPPERNGIRLDDTGAIQFVCANIPEKHEDKEVFFELCPSCARKNYFFMDHELKTYVCYACVKPVDPALVKCPECGRPPRTWRTKPAMNKN